MKKTIFLIIFLSIFVTAQDQNPNVELPEFVITGRKVSTLTKAKKIEPEFISTVSKDFLKPGFSPEELELVNFPDANIQEIQLLDSLNYNNGRLFLGAGRYTLPEADFSIAHIYETGLLEVYGLGKNSLKHIANSEKYYFNGGVNLFYNIDNQSAFLPGTQIKIHADYGNSAYKFYASEIPVLKRTHHTGNLSFSLNNLLDDNVIYGFKIADNISSLKDETFTENLLNINAFTRFSYSSLLFTASGVYKQQFLTISDSVDFMPYGKSFFAVRPTVGLNLAESFKAEFGINYSKSGNNNFLSPYASIAFKFNDKVSIFGEFTPQAEFYSSGNFLGINPYFNPGNYLNVYLKKTNQIKTALKYEFDKYFQIDGGINYFTANNLPYFNDSFVSGRFDIAVVEATSLSAYLNLLFHSGPYGIFYGTVELSNTEADTSGNAVPYYPSIKSSLSYGYNFTDAFSGEAELYYSSKVYTDIANTKSLKPYVDLGLKFSYMILPDFTLSFELNNILSNNNYRWNNYKEAPMDLVGGVKYVW